MKKEAEKISASELEVMHVLWQAQRPLTITEIRLELQQKTDWEPTTIKTLVQRLCTKGVLFQENSRPFLYSPRISENEYKDWATNDLISRLYHGSARRLVAALVKSDSLSAEDVEELRDFFRMEDEE